MPINHQKHSFLTNLEKSAAQEKLDLYLVGGFLRDNLLGKNSTDLDLSGRKVTIDWVMSVARREQWPAQYIRRHGLVRLTLAGTHIDVSELKGDRLETDLAQRDFTVNAMALPLADYLYQNRRNWKVIDPFSGMNDLRKNRLHALPAALKDDPVRILRGARISRRLGLTFTDATLQESRAAASMLSQSPKERIAAEILSTLASDAKGFLPLLSALGVDGPLFGARVDNRPDYITARLEALLRPGFYSEHIHRACRAHLAMQLTIPHTRLQLLRMTALCCDVYRMEEHCVPFFLTAKREKTAFSQTMDGLSWLQKNTSPLDDAKICRYFQMFGEAGVEGLLLFSAASGPQATRRVVMGLQAYAVGSKLIRPPRYLDGRTIAHETGKRGLGLSEIKRADLVLQYATAVGMVQNHQQADQYLQGYIDGKLLNLCRKNIM